uniref:Uncharacterized protein n=1 Tax=Strongyloides stercoralis TaxID=6248 RepID=A0A0K0E7K8_STRER
MEDVVEGIEGCCSTGAGSKTYKFFFGRNSFINNAKYDKQSRYVFLFQSTALEFRYYCCCFGGCCSTGIDSETLELF